MSNNDINTELIPVGEIKPPSPELEALRKELGESKGPRFWRTLEEHADQQAFGELLEREFPRGASEWLDPVTRRNFLKLAGASMALAGLAGCTKQPLEQILPYVRQPVELVPGKPIYFATAMPFAGHVQPLLVETHEYRPTKVEGNPQHGAAWVALIFSRKRPFLIFMIPIDQLMSRITASPALGRVSGSDSQPRVVSQGQPGRRSALPERLRFLAHVWIADEGDSAGFSPVKVASLGTGPP